MGFGLRSVSILVGAWLLTACTSGGDGSNTRPPPIEVSLSGTAGTSGGILLLAIDFPEDVSRFQEVKIVRKSGATAPTDCSDGTAVVTYTSGQFTDGNFSDEGLPGAAIYSYLACATDIQGNVSSTSYSNHKAENLTVRPYTIFLSANVPDANFGGVTGADAICQAEATTNGLPGTWKAIISQTGINAKDRIRVTGQVVRNDWNSGGPTVITETAETTFWSSTLENIIYCRADESQCNMGNFTWTGTNADGTANANNCLDWTSSNGADEGAVGLSTNAANWLFFVDTGACNGAFLSLYCIDGQ